MSKLSTSIALATALILPLSVPASAAPLRIAPVTNVTPASDQVLKVGVKLTGKQRLKRLFRSHTRAGNPIIQSVRDATGDPNIVVFDHRGGSFFQNYRCSYITYRGKRALTCD